MSTEAFFATIKEDYSPPCEACRDAPPSVGQKQTALGGTPDLEAHTQQFRSRVEPAPDRLGRFALFGSSFPACPERTPWRTRRTPGAARRAGPLRCSRAASPIGTMPNVGIPSTS